MDVCGCCGDHCPIPAYPKGACDCEGNTLDCNGNCGGTDYIDECGVCNGDGIHYHDGFCDCEGHVLDVCGICDGNGI